MEEEVVAHWPQKNSRRFAYYIASAFMSQLEWKMDSDGISRSELAKKMGKTPGRITQVFNDPGNMSLRVMVEHAGALGMKVCVVGYEDPDNTRGPLHPDVLVKTWQLAGCPANLFEAEEAAMTEATQAHFWSPEGVIHQHTKAQPAGIYPAGHGGWGKTQGTPLKNGGKVNQPASISEEKRASA